MLYIMIVREAVVRYHSAVGVLAKERERECVWFV